MMLLRSEGGGEGGGKREEVHNERLWKKRRREEAHGERLRRRRTVRDSGGAQEEGKGRKEMEKKTRGWKFYVRINEKMSFLIVFAKSINFINAVSQGSPH